MSRELQPTHDDCVMTLKDIVDFINQTRGVSKGDKGFKLHAHSLTTIKKLSSESPSFGGLKVLTLNYNGQDYETLCLNKKQAIAVGAKLDNTLLMQVIDRVEELENKSTQKFQIPKTLGEALLLAGKLEIKNETLALENKKKDQVIKKKDLIITDIADLNIRAGDVLIGDFAKNLALPDLGQNNMFKWLKARGYLMDNRKPYQPYVTRGYFVEKPSEEKINGKVRYTTYLTAKGTVWLTRLIKADYEID